MAPPGVCGPWPLPTVRDRGFLGHNELWSLLECAALGRSSQCGTRAFLWAHRQPGSLDWSLRPLLAVWDPRFSWAYRQPTFCLLKLGKRIAATRNVRGANREDVTFLIFGRNNTFAQRQRFGADSEDDVGWWSNYFDLHPRWS